MKKSTSVIITAIICLSMLEMMALYKGINGMVFTGVVAAIAGLGGWAVPRGTWMK